MATCATIRIPANDAGPHSGPWQEFAGQVSGRDRLPPPPSSASTAAGRRPGSIGPATSSLPYSAARALRLVSSSDFLALGLGLLTVFRNRRPARRAQRIVEGGITLEPGPWKVYVA